MILVLKMKCKGPTDDPQVLRLADRKLPIGLLVLLSGAWTLNSWGRLSPAPCSMSQQDFK